MQVHYDEGVANHIGPEPCAVSREVKGDASVGDHIGQPLSRESRSFRVLTPFCCSEGNTTKCAMASAWSARRGRRPWYVWTLLAREPGDLTTGPSGVGHGSGSASGRRGAVADDARV